MQRLDSETYILTRMMAHDDAARQGAGELTDRDFTDARHKSIFRAIKACMDKDYDIELLAVATMIKDMGGTDQTVIYLQQMDSSASYSGSSLNKYIDELRVATQQRSLRAVVDKVDTSLEKNELSPQTIIDEIYKDVASIANTSGKQTVFTLDEVMKDFEGSGKSVIQVIQERQEDHQKGIVKLRGLPTGFQNLDTAIKGLVPGHFTIVAARTGVGKTTFALNIICNLLRQDIPVSFFSLEMQASQVLIKLTSIHADLDGKFEDGVLSSSDYQRFLSTLQALGNKPLTMETRGHLSVNQIVNMIRQDARSRGVKAFFIDYLGRISGGGKFNSRQEELHYISVRLAECAKDENVCIVCIAQLNRESVKTEKPRAPRDSDIADSGQIERDAVNILLLHRPDMYDPYDKPGQVIVKLVKQRFGKPGDLNFVFKGETGRYIEMKGFKSEIEEKKDLNMAQHDQEVASEFDAFSPSSY